jgi:hypothetical protein
LYVLICHQFLRARLRSLTWLLALCMIGAAVETALIHPDYLSFFNRLAGGPAHGERYFIDSNVDLGPGR